MLLLRVAAASCSSPPSRPDGDEQKVRAVGVGRALRRTMTASPCRRSVIPAVAILLGVADAVTHTLCSGASGSCIVTDRLEATSTDSIVRASTISAYHVRIRKSA